jgi:polysaccharide biosynthesis transport protein
MNERRNELPLGNSVAPGSLVPAGQSTALAREPYGPVGAYSGGAADDLAVNVFQYWRILIRRKWLIGSVAVASVALGALATLMTMPLYTAAVRLQIDRNVAKIVESGNVTPVEGSDVEFLRTQYELLQSRSVAERAASALKLADDREFFQPRRVSITGAVKGAVNNILGSTPADVGTRGDRAAAEQWAASIILANRAVRPVAGSRLVDVMYSDPVPVRAQRIAGGIADAFIAANLDKRFQANAYAKTFLEDQIKQLKLRLEESERVLLEFAEREQIVVVTEKSSIAENNLAAANAALGVLVSERMKNEQLWKQLESADAINLPQLLSNAVIDGLRARRNALVTEYEEKLETFKPAYPTMVQINNKIKEIDRQLVGEVKTIKNSLKAAYEASASQEGDMRKQITVLKEEVLDLQKRSIQYNILKREVDTNRSLYDGLLQRYKEVDVAGGAGANNVFVVDRAEVPGAPSSPNLSHNLMLSLALGLGAGLFAAYFLERFDDSIKSAEKAEWITGLATLGIIPKVRTADKVESEFLDPRSGLSEAYRSLCASLQFATASGLPRTLFVTSAGPSEGKSFTSLAIARHFATVGMKVLLIDGDLRNPSLHTKIGVDQDIGFSDYLTGACKPPETFQKTGLDNLAFMASGPLPPNAADLLAGSRLFSLFSVGMEVFDLIIIDGPPVLGLADAPLLSSAAAATIFVVGAGQVRTALVRAALKRLQYARGTLIGTVLTKFDAKNADYGYGYGHGYGYSSHGYGYGSRYGGNIQALPGTVKQEQREQLLTSAREKV